MAATHSTSRSGDLSPTLLRIPNLLSSWPWKRRISPFYEEVVEEANTWIRSLAPFNTRSQHAIELCKPGLLSALMVPDACREHLRTSVDLNNISYVIDEYTDVEAAPVVRQMVDICLDALHHPDVPRPANELVLGELVRQFWERGLRSATPQGAKHFVASLTNYLNALAEEAQERERTEVIDIDNYLRIRRESAAVRCSYAIGELGFSMADEVCTDPKLIELVDLGCDLIVIDNDVVSYNREQATGIAQFNIITVVMHHQGVDYDAAVRWLESLAAELEARYMACLEDLKASFDANAYGYLHQFLDHMGTVRRAGWCWSFECGRYFGDRGLEYAETGMVPLIPKKEGKEGLRLKEVEILVMEDELAKLPLPCENTEAGWSSS